MGLQQNLNDIQTNLLSAKTAIAQSISNKGVECSATDKLSTFAEKIDSISGGSTGGTGNKIMLTNGTKFAYSTAFDPTLYDVSNVTDMSNMFYNSSQLTGELDLSSWDVSSVTTMKELFSNCSELISIDLSNWNTKNVKTMFRMFYSCSRLTSINVSNFDVSNVYSYDSMFYNCSGLTSIDLSNWNTEKLQIINEMFSRCSGLTSIDLSNWNTVLISTARSLFSNCSRLTSIDLSNWSTKILTDIDYMFSGCTALTNLQFSDLGRNQRCTPLDLSTCSKLTKDSILYLFNNAFDRTAAGYTKAFTIKLNAATKALLSEDELAIATNKGFTVV